ncbi:MAG TPA: rhodanese-like domain-containing protein [Candidatus Paceibacterota bacterium]|nr:rhodanese-like domain-containing protein [Candidatus Paceibacterota bacterium]
MKLRLGMRKKTLRSIAGLATGVLVLSGCSSSSGSVTSMDVQNFSKKTQETGVITLDVRTRGEFNQGHIAGAINIDVESDTFQNEVSKLDKTKTYAVYCQSGRRSGIATDEMKKLGFAHLFNLSNGMNDWMSQGMQLMVS